ncbi:MAG: cbb3-type cytochrome c oxidase subunit I [Acidimicrobiales bacterium]
MAIIEEPLALPAGANPGVSKPLGVFSRPRNATGLKNWLTTVDHKKIGIMYGAAAMFFLVIGGVAALLIRLQLAVPNNELLSGDAYNRAYTMHGTIMIFLVVMPIGAAFANYLLPLQIGARDVAFLASMPSASGCSWLADFAQHVVVPWWRSRRWLVQLCAKQRRDLLAEPRH